jgi:hypothetical protein
MINVLTALVGPEGLDRPPNLFLGTSTVHLESVESFVFGLEGIRVKAARGLVNRKRKVADTTESRWRDRTSQVGVNLIEDSKRCSGDIKAWRRKRV